MNKIPFFILLLVGVLMYSCKDDALAPIATFDNLGKGAFPRLISRTSPQEFDIRNLGSAKYDMSVDFTDIDKGNTVTKYDFYVSYKDNTGGTSTKAEKLFKSYGSGDFITSEAGKKGLTVSFSYTELAAALGLTDADISYNDQFKFRTTVTNTDGIEFGSHNTTPDIPASLSGLFDWNITTTCPLGDLFTGAYTLSYENPPTGALGVVFGATPGAVTLAKGTTSTRTFKIVYLPDGKTAAQKTAATVTVTLTFACNEIRMSKITTKLTCGQGRVTITQDAPTPFTFDSDGSFKLQLTEFATNGGCTDANGVPAAKAPFTLIFTK